MTTQKAIEAITDFRAMAHGHAVLAEAFDMAIEALSAQPEIIRCKDCKWCEDADGLMCQNTVSWVVATDYDFGCVCAERRQDG